MLLIVYSWSFIGVWCDRVNVGSSIITCMHKQFHSVAAAAGAAAGAAASGSTAATDGASNAVLSK